MRPIPKVALLPCPPDYARYLGEGWDSVQEAYNVNLSPAFVTMMEDAQSAARKGDNRKGGLAPMTLGGEPFHMHAKGTRGSRWVIEHADFQMMIAAPGTEWPLSIRYLSHALWREGGVASLRDLAFASLRSLIGVIGDDFARVTRADYCFDFHSPAFTVEHRLGTMLPRFVCHKFCKRRSNGKVQAYDDDDGSDVGADHHGQTATVGSKANVQVQIYNKSIEISEKSGKDWFYRVWAEYADGEILTADVHRIEVRFGSQFFKDRNYRAPEDVFSDRKELVTDALYRIRLTCPTADSNRRRWPVQQMWSEAIRRCGATALRPIGHQITGRLDALTEEGLKAMAGTVRSFCAMVYRDYKRDDAVRVLHKVLDMVEEDPKHFPKLDQALFRTANVERPK